MDTKKLRQKILDLAIRGKLVPQDPNDEPASVLLERIRAEKERLVKEGKIKKSKASKTSDKPHYENVPFEVPQSWCWTTLGEIFTLQAGKNIAAKEISDRQDETCPFPCYGGNGIRGYVSSHNRNGHFPLIGRQGALCGNINVADGLFYATEHAVVVETYCNIDVVWAVNALTYLNLNQYATSTAQPGLSVSTINEVMIPLPPIKEQNRIVYNLSKWFALIDTVESGKSDLQTSIKQAKSKILDLAIHGKLVPQDPNDEPASELLKRINPKAEITCDNGQYEKMPEGWCLCQFGEYLDVRDGTHDSPKYVEKGYPFITSKNLNHGKIEFCTAKFISEEDHKFFSQRSFVEDGDILFAMIGSIGNPVLVVKDRDFSIKNVALFKPYNRKNTYMEYVLYYLLYIQETLKRDAKGGMQPFIPLNYFRKDLYIILPPIEEQYRMVTKIDELFASLDNIQKALEV